MAENQVENLSPVRLSKTICAQFKVKVARAHEHFLLALQELESCHSARLQETGEARVEVSFEVEIHADNAHGVVFSCATHCPNCASVSTLHMRIHFGILLLCIPCDALGFFLLGYEL